MSGHYGRIQACDSECAFVNHCRVGGLVCRECGLYFCAEDLNEDGLCEDCANQLAEDEDGEPDFGDEDYAKGVGDEG